MAGVKGRSGRRPGSTPGPGRKRTSLRQLGDSIGDEIRNFVSMLGESADITVGNVEIVRCACGAISISDYWLLAHAHNPLPEPDEQGNIYPLLGRVDVKGTKPQHSKRCKG